MLTGVAGGKVLEVICPGQAISACPVCILSTSQLLVPGKDPSARADNEEVVEVRGCHCTGDWLQEAALEGQEVSAYQGSQQVLELLSSEEARTAQGRQLCILREQLQGPTG